MRVRCSHFVSAPPAAETATGGASSPLTTDGEG